MKIILRIGESAFTATMHENQSVKIFASLLPVTLTLGEYNREERRSCLPKRLSVDGTEEGMNSFPKIS